MRIRGAKTELEEAGLETDGMVESTAKLRQEILALSGVDIMENANEFKSTYKIMDELAAKWEDLTDIQQASITELIAGKRQGNIVSSLMSNFDTARKALETSQNSAGSAMREHAKWSESLEARLNKLKAAWQGLSQAFLSSDFLKGALDGVISLVDGITKLIDTIGTLPTLIGVFASFKILKTVFSTISTGKGLKELGGILGTLKKAFPNVAGGAKKLVKALREVSLASGGAGTAFHGFLSLIMQHPYIAIAAVAVTALTAAFAYQKKQAEDLAKEVDELTSKYREEHKALSDIKGDFDTTNESSMISKYEKLSKGVDGLGRNVSLTSEEYSEYQDIVNSIADQIPSLISGYDEQGNALLSCKGNVEELTAAYEKLIHAQNQEILTNVGDIEKDFANTLDKSSGRRLWSNGHGFWAGLVGNSTGAGALIKPLLDYELKSDTVQGIQDLLNATSEKEKKKASKNLRMDRFSSEEIRDALSGAGIEVGFFEDPVSVLEETIEKDPQKVINFLNNYYTQFSEDIEQQKTIAQAKLSEAFDVSSAISGLNYGNINEDLQAVAYQVVNSFDYDFLSNLSESGKSVEQWVTEMLDQFNSISKEDNAKIEAAFDLKTQFNGGDISYGDYVNSLRDVKSTIENLGLDEKVEEQLKLSLDLDDEGVIGQYDALKNRLTSEEFGIQIKTDEAEKLLNELTASEYAAVVDLIMSGKVDLSKFDIKSLREYIKKEAEFLDAMTFTIAIDVETESIEALNTALTESISATGLSSESITALKGRYAELESQGYSLSSMFEETANGIHLNREAINEFERALVLNKLSETKSNLEILKNRYDELTEKINNCSDASERANLYRDQQSIVDQINDLGTLAAQYEGLTSVYNAWLSAESSGSERDMYEKVIEGFETVADEISRGWMDDGSIKFLELLTGRTDLASKSASELKEIYKGLDENIKNTSYSIRDFFTVDEDGNSTSAGVYNFLKAIEQLEKSDTKVSGLEKTFKEIEGIENLIQRDEKTGRITAFNFSVVGGDEAIAEALGISEELVQIMLRAADDAGFVVTLDGDWTLFSDLQNQAEEANDTIKRLSQTNEKLKEAGFGEYDFDFGTDSIEELDKDLEKAKELLNSDVFKDANGNFNINAEGAKEALKIAETLLIAKQQLEEPAYMSIDVSGLQKELQKPVELLQDFEILTQEKELLNLTGQDKERLNEIDTELNSIVTQLSNLDKETKVKLGIDGKTPEQIREELENGTIEIPAELTIEANMDKNLEDLVTLGLLEQGLITEQEAKIRLGIEVEPKVDNSNLEEDINNAVTGAINGATLSGDSVGIGNGGIPEGTGYTANSEVVYKAKAIAHFVADPSEVEAYTPEQKEAVVKFVADTMGVDGYTPEEKEAYAKYLVDGGDLDAYTPEEKEVIARYLASDEELDAYTPEEQEVIVKFLNDTTAVDNYTPEQKEAIAKFIKDSTEPDGYQPPSKIQDVIADLDSTEPDGYQPPEKTMTIWAKIKKVASNLWNQLTGGGDEEGGSGANGTANVDGTTGRAFKQGSWGTKNSGTALVGELGTETLVRGGRYYTIGNNGAEFIKYQKGDIIFNHKQTEELFKNGRVTSDGGRAKALVSGTAFSWGSGGGLYPEKESYPVGRNPSSSSSKKDKDSSDKSSSSSSAAADEFEETLDWIEIKISRIERAIDQLDRTASSTYKVWSTRNNALIDEIGKVGEEIGIQQAAYERYMAEANSVGLSSEWAEKVRNGAIDITTITNEGLAEKIGKYQEWYEKALDCQDAIEELRETEASLYKQRFDNVSTQYDGILSIIEHEKNMLEEYISQSEANAWLISANYYDALAKNERDTIEELKNEKAELLSSLQTAMESGTIEKGSEAWVEMVNAIDEVTLAIEESNTQLTEYQQTLQQLSWETFDLLQEKISAVTEESEFLIELMSNDKLYDDRGQLTGSGMTTMGLHGQNYNTYMYQADLAADEAEKLRKELEQDPFDTDLEARYREMIALQQEHILAAQGEKEAICDMVEEGINLELEALQELIDKKNEQLQSEKDLYDYQKKVQQQTEEIASLEKQMAAYSGDTSEEAKAKIQELKVSLEDARADLEESEYDKYISDQQQLLDELYLEYETILNARLDNIDSLISDMITEINANASTIGETIKNAASDVGYTLSNSMATIWTENSTGTNNVIEMYSKNFIQLQTTTNNALNVINVNLQNMINQLNTIAKTNVKSASISSASNSAQANAKPKNNGGSNNNSSSSSSSSSGSGSGKGNATSGSSASSSSSNNSSITVGKKITVSSNAKIYDYAGDTSGEGQYFRNDPVYTVLGEKGDYVKVRWHKANSGVTGWFKKSDIKSYATGKKNFLENEIAWTQEDGQEMIIRPSDGAILTPIAKGDSVLNANASGNIWDMANSPAEFIKDNLNLGVANVPNNSNVNNVYNQTIEKVMFDFENVKNYDEILCALKDDRRFEKLITAMTFDRAAGKSSLAKGKSIR